MRAACRAAAPGARGRAPLGVAAQGARDTRERRGAGGTAEPRSISVARDTADPRPLPELATLAMVLRRTGILQRAVRGESSMSTASS